MSRDEKGQLELLYFAILPKQSTVTQVRQKPFKPDRKLPQIGSHMVVPNTFSLTKTLLYYPEGKLDEPGNSGCSL